MSIENQAQKLEPGAKIELFELDAVSLGGDISRFHAHRQVESIWWQGAEYFPWPVETTGFNRSGDKPANPTLRVGNVNGSISALCMFFDDLVGAKIIRRRTLAQFLDARNFAGGNPTADPTEEFPPEVWYIEQKMSETPEVVEFQLSSALDLNGVKLPRRQIIANLCTWMYRSPECGYTGGAVADTLDRPVTELSQDKCGKRLSSCKLRFGNEGALPFGGFPAAGLVRS